MTGPPGLFDYTPPPKPQSKSKATKNKSTLPKSSMPAPSRYPVFGTRFKPTLGLACSLAVALLWVGLGTELTGVGPVSFRDSGGPATGALTFLGLGGFGIWFAASAVNAGRCNFGSFRDRQALKHYPGKWRAYAHRAGITALSLCAVLSAAFMGAHCFQNAQTVYGKVAENVFRVPEIQKAEVAENALPPVLKAEPYGPPSSLGPPTITGSIGETTKPKPRRDKVEKPPLKDVDSLVVTVRRLRAWFEETFTGPTEDDKTKKSPAKKG